MGGEKGEYKFHFYNFFLTASLYTFGFQTFIMRMYTRLLLTFLLLATSTGFSQQRKDLVVSLSSGLLSSSYYENDVSGGYYSAGMDYGLTNKHFLQFCFTTAENTYLEREMSNVTSNLQIPGYANSFNRIWSIGIGYKYKLDFPNFVLWPGAAVGMIRQTRTFPYRFTNYESTMSYSETQIVFPVTLEADYKLGRHWLLGLKGGLLICPDYPITGIGLHAGPVVSYVIK